MKMRLKKGRSHFFLYMVRGKDMNFDSSTIRVMIRPGGSVDQGQKQRNNLFLDEPLHLTGGF